MNGRGFWSDSEPHFQEGCQTPVNELSPQQDVSTGSRRVAAGYQAVVPSMYSFAQPLDIVHGSPGRGVDPGGDISHSDWSGSYGVQGRAELSGATHNLVELVFEEESQTSCSTEEQ